jgi:hypothetical protein
MSDITLPALDGIADPSHISKKGDGRFQASYINWARTLHDIRTNAPGWVPFAEKAPDGGLVHLAPDGTGFLLIGWTRYPDGPQTPTVPHAIMDNRMQSRTKIDARAVTDAFVRGACKSAALLLGYGWQMWSKDDPMERDDDEPADYKPPPKTRKASRPAEKKAEKGDKLLDAMKAAKTLDELRAAGREAANHPDLDTRKRYEAVYLDCLRALRPVSRAPGVHDYLGPEKEDPGDYPDPPEDHYDREEP